MVDIDAHPAAVVGPGVYRLPGPYEADGSVRVEPGTGVVLVLIPGGTFVTGSQPYDPDTPNFDEGSRPHERPPVVRDTSPFFLAKHELTQAQWLRLAAAENPRPRDGSSSKSNQIGCRPPACSPEPASPPS